MSLCEETCDRKRRYETWDEAERAGLLVWRESPRPYDANPAGAYPCAILGEPHYHCGHAGSREKDRVPA